MSISGADFDNRRREAGECAICLSPHPARTEAFAEFRKILQPILAEIGVDAGEPAVLPVHLLDQTSVEGKF
jgi:hypothetical protein